MARLIIFSCIAAFGLNATAGYSQTEPLQLFVAEYQLSVALLDPYDKKPAIQFAIAERDADHWHPLTHWTIASLDHSAFLPRQPKL